MSGGWIIFLFALVLASLYVYLRRNRLWGRRLEQPSVQLLDPDERRTRQVEETYARGEIADEDLEWCVLLALRPPEPTPRQILERKLREAMTAPILLLSDASVVPITSITPWTASVPTTAVIPWTAASVPAEDDTEPVTLYDANGNTQSIVRRRKADQC
jgi:hypothetical protein